MQKKSKHSKFKNAGILFELLTRQVTAEILSGKNVSPAKDLLFKYFKESKELGKEWQLYNFLISEKVDTESKAERALMVVLKNREKLDSKKLNEEKYNLIKEIKAFYPLEDLLKSNIRNYKTLASIYKVFEDHITTDKFEVSEIFQARNFIIESMSSKKTKVEPDEQMIELYKKQSEDLRLLSYKILVESVNTKYKDLDSRQKTLLSEYINNISNTNSLSSFIVGEIDKIKVELNTLSEQIDSAVTKIKIQEVHHQLDNIKNIKTVKDNHVMVLLLSYELIKEISKTV